MRVTCAALFLAACLGCSEWVQLAPEPESYPFETARRICHAHAQRESEGDRLGFPPGQRSDPGIYQHAFRTCMRAHGWVLRRKGSTPGPRESEPPAGSRG